MNLMVVNKKRDLLDLYRILQSDRVSKMSHESLKNLTRDFIRDAVSIHRVIHLGSVDRLVRAREEEFNSIQEERNLFRNNTNLKFNDMILLGESLVLPLYQVHIGSKVYEFSFTDLLRHVGEWTMESTWPRTLHDILWDHHFTHLDRYVSKNHFAPSVSYNGISDAKFQEILHGNIDKLERNVQTLDLSIRKY